MTIRGEILSEVSSGELRELLAAETDAKAVKRLVVALEYTEGLSPAAIGQKYGWPESTVYSWLRRFDERGPVAALRDEPRPGRPSRLSDAQRRQYVAAVQEPPSAVGLDAPAWSPALLQEYLVREFGVEYSLEHCRRLLHAAGLSVQTARPTHFKADPARQRAWRREFKKSGRD